MELNLGQVIASRAASHPERLAIIHGETRWSYGELLERADAVADRLCELLVDEFSRAIVPRVGLFCPNGAEYVALALGILRAGACFVPVASELAIPERESQVTLTAQHLVLAAGPRPWLPKAGTDEETSGIRWSWTRTVSEAQFPEDRFAALQPAFVRFSSGTTGASKGVVLGLESLLARVRSANRRLRVTPDDRVLWILPMAHHFAVSIVLYLLEGATTVLADSHLAAEVLTIGRDAGATILYGSPFHYQLLAAEESGRDWPTLRLAVSTAAALSSATASAFRARYGVPVTQGLGIIEAGLPLLNTDAADTKPQSVGRADDFEVDFRGPAGNELWLRGPGMFDAYLLPWRERAQITTDGWFSTGDIAERDADGHIFLQGRTKSVINVGGMKVFPEEVEAVVDAHPGVLVSRVSGEAHERWGTIIVAEIIARDPAALPEISALNRHCRERLSGYKIPQRFRFVTELPRTPTGKLRR